MTCSITGNPLLSTSELPLFEHIDIGTHGGEAMDDCITNQNKAFNIFEDDLRLKLENNSPITFQAIFDNLDKIQEPLSKTYGIISHLSGVADSEDIRSIKDKYRSELVDIGKNIGQSRTIYDALCRVVTTDVNEQRALTLSIESMQRGGVNLSDEKKCELTLIDKELSNASTKFSENILDATKEYKLVIDDVNHMINVPQWCREMWNTQDPDNGPWIITLGGPSISAALRFISDRETRKTLYTQYISRAGDINEPLIQTILKLRHKKANILGFETFTKLSLASKMAKDEDEIEELMNSLRDVALPLACDEFKCIESYALEHGNIQEVKPWDLGFWCERLSESKFKMKEEELKPYFSLENVMKELFHIAHKLFGVRIEQRTIGKVELWHSDVRYFDVYEEETDSQDNVSNEKRVAGFYLDPYVREESKRGGAWMDSCIDKNRALNKLIPVAYLVCNGSPPTKDKPSLMSFSDVETLFHEFGHGLQHMLTRIDIGDIAGINNIEWDAVELPSQFMENWCYHKETLDRMAIHYKDNSNLPKHMYDSLVAQKNHGVAMATMRQVAFSKLDLYLHSNWVNLSNTDNVSIWDIQNKMFEECTPYRPQIANDQFLSTFSHIFGGGYAAGYYSYKWAEVMSADCFGAFEENIDELVSIGRRFRNTVLAMGGSRPAMDVFVEFRGRKPTINALLRHNGMKLV